MNREHFRALIVFHAQGFGTIGKLASALQVPKRTLEKWHTGETCPDEFKRLAIAKQLEQAPAQAPAVQA